MYYSGLIKRFHLVWLIYWFVYLIQPVQSAYQEIRKAWSLQLLFVITVSLAYFTVRSLLAKNIQSHSEYKKKYKPQEFEEIIRWGLCISFLGICFIFIDKIFIQKIDYLEGLSHARTQWITKAEQRNGSVSSPFSLLGYLFGGAYYLSLILTNSTYNSLNSIKRLFYLCLGFTLLMLNCIATGGRSSLLLAAGLLSFSFYSCKTNKFLKDWSINKNKAVLLIMLMLATAYIIYIFYSRAVASQINLATYSQNFLSYLGLKSKPWFAEFADSSKIGTICASVNLTFSYLTHSLSTFAAIIRHGNDTGDAMFSLFVEIAAKISNLPKPKSWFLAGRLPSLPGAFYVKWGLMGLLLGACALGVIAGKIFHSFAIRKKTAVIIFACSIVECVLLLSPFLFAGDILFFPSMVIGGLIAVVVGKWAASKDTKNIVRAIYQPIQQKIKSSK